ncbi:hypothetical protein SAY87_004539 [Trapa incisa]|uniref:ER lumen protein retaining receptor n=1 Tax=Trapa incisa TaxID=236973 RepID=A0AAN7JPU9_9MYRT|nr:hypothetical protein SAY87_004539 [Trapa incisa]
MGRKRDSKLMAEALLLRWLRKLPTKLKVFLGVSSMVVMLIVLQITLKNHLINLFIASEICHAVGIIVLIYKLKTQKTCFGLSLKTQELTAMFMATRIICNYYVGFYSDGVLDFVTHFVALLSTLWVIYMIRFKLKSTYIKEHDNFSMYYLAILSAAVHPKITDYRIIQYLFAFYGYLESVSVLPQLRFIQNAKMIEPFTGHYIFALGVSRFLSLAFWIIQIYNTRGTYFYLIGSGYFWILAAILGELLQSFILADFCYYYIRSYMKSQLIMAMPV